MNSGKGSLSYASDHQAKHVMNKNFSIIFAILIVILAVLNMIYDQPDPMTVWDFFGWVTGQP